MPAYRGTATTTATTGPGRTVTAAVLTGIKAFFVDIEKQMLFYYTENDDQNSPPKHQFALGSTMTMTTVIASGNWTITVSVS